MPVRAACSCRFSLGEQRHAVRCKDGPADQEVRTLAARYRMERIPVRLPRPADAGEPVVRAGRWPLLGLHWHPENRRHRTREGVWS